MVSPSQQKSSALLAGLAAFLAAVALALLSLFPAARSVALFLTILAGALFWMGEPEHKTGQGRRFFPRTPLDLPIVLLLLQIGVSFWASAFPEKTWVAVSQLAAGLVAYYAAVNWSRDRIRLWWTVAALIVLGISLALISPFAVDWLRGRAFFLPEGIYRPFPLLLADVVHPNVMASSLVTLIPFPLALFLALPARQGRRSWLRMALLAITLVEIVVVFLTQSRGGYIALGVSVLLTLWLSGQRRWAIGLIVIVCALTVWLTIRSPNEMAGVTDATQIALDTTTWTFRQSVWHTAIRVIGDFPLTGTGPGTFNDAANLLYGFHSPENPGAHNLFLQVAVDLGLLGLVCLLAILILVLCTAYRALRLCSVLQESNLRAIAIAGMSGTVATISHGLFDIHTWGTKGAFIPWMVAGLMVALYSLVLALSLKRTDRQEPENS